MRSTMARRNDRQEATQHILQEGPVSQHTIIEGTRGIEGLLQSRLSRGKLLTATAAGLAVAAIPHRAGAQTTAAPESVQDIINIRVTNEFFGVTLLTAAVKNADQLGLSANGGMLLRVIQAALAEEQYHVDYLTSQGAKPTTTTFTIPDPKILTDPLTFFSTVEFIETIEISMDMSATRQFSEMGQVMLAQVAYQIGGVEAEHRVLARAALALLGQQSDIPPNNRAFETDIVYYLRDAVAIFQQRGFLGGSGQAVTYPGRDVALAAAGTVGAAVTDKTP
jgi:hypothetical protein